MRRSNHFCLIIINSIIIWDNKFDRMVFNRIMTWTKSGIHSETIINPNSIISIMIYNLIKIVKVSEIEYWEKYNTIIFQFSFLIQLSTCFFVLYWNIFYLSYSY